MGNPDTTIEALCGTGDIAVVNQSFRYISGKDSYLWRNSYVCHTNGEYIKPEERTMDFAFMFIPSEAVYYDLLINKVGAISEDTNNLIYYASKKKVVVVSPTSFLAYLQTVLQGLRSQKISEEAQLIIKRVEDLRRHIFVYSEYLEKLGQHLNTTVSTYNKAGREFEKIDKDVVKIAGGDGKIKIKEAEYPLLDDKSE